MKIISKYKDYYDYLMGIRGVDPLIVLDRRKGIVHKPIDIKPSLYKFALIQLAICDVMHYGLIGKNGRVYWGKSMHRFGDIEKDWYHDNRLSLRVDGATLPLEPTVTDVNAKCECPVVFVQDSRKEEVTLYPQLRAYGVQKWYKSEDIYTDISNWISSRIGQTIEDKRTDLEKLQNAGFDRVTSFRNIK